MLVAFGAAGCSVFQVENPVACATSELERIGLKDGQLGLPIKDRDRLFEVCGETATVLVAYAAARNEGLKDYCTRLNGFEVGRTGMPYFDVCPPERERAFLRGLDQGYAVERGAGWPSPEESYGLGVKIGSARRGRVDTNIAISIGHPNLLF